MSRPRIRTIKPELWQDEKIGELTRDQRILLLGLITMADDEGRLRALSSLILGQVFPWDADVSPVKLRRWMAAIEDTGLVVQYEHDGKPYAAFRHWKRHQRINRPSPSLLPPPPDPEIAAANAVAEFSERDVSDHGTDHDSLTPSRAGARSDPILVPVPDPSGVTKEDARDLFEYWQRACGHPQAKATRDRIAKVHARLREGYTPEQIREAIDGAARGAFVNDAGKRFDDLELICRSGSKLESFIGRLAQPNGRAGSGPTAEDFMAIARGEA